jgi:hypothetical protein
MAANKYYIADSMKKMAGKISKIKNYFLWASFLQKMAFEYLERN